MRDHDCNSEHLSLICNNISFKGGEFHCTDVWLYDIKSLIIPSLKIACSKLKKYFTKVKFTSNIQDQMKPSFVINHKKQSDLNEFSDIPVTKLRHNPCRTY